MMPAIAIGILGPIVINGPEGASSHPTGREARVLAAMALSANRAIPRSLLIEAVWGDSPPATPDTALHNVVYRLRRSLGEAGIAATVAKEADGYSLQADPMIIDVTRFESLIATAEDEECPARRATLAQAIDLWRGDPFGARMNGSSLFRAEAQRLRALRWIAVEDRIRCDLEADNHREVIPELVALTTQAPIRETLWTYLIAALYRSDQRGRALQVFQQAQQYLADELGIEPSRTLQELATAVVEQDDEIVARLIDRA